MIIHPEPTLPEALSLPPQEALEKLLNAGVAGDVARLMVARQVLRRGRLPTLKPLLPLLLTLKGKPYTLRNHYPFEPFFQTHLAREFLLKTGRQCGKSSCLAAQGIVQSNCLPDFNTLYVTPLYEQIRRFSTNYVRALLDRSPAKRLWMGSHTTNSVLERSFTNYSKMTFSFAFLDADRTRGIPADCLTIDEVQDLDPTFTPIMKETLSASPWALTRYAGTPKTLDGTLEQFWLSSSQAEWEIICHACHYANIPALTHDLIDMIGPESRTVSEKTPGVVCAKCRRHGKLTSIYPRTGRWVHANPELRYTFPGYHIPQIIMPMHYADPDKWTLLLAKQRGMGNTPPNVFYNEVCGESYDVGAKLVTITDLKRAAVLNPNTLEDAVVAAPKYINKVLAVDWGGGGEKRISFTSLAAMGQLPDGTLECFYGFRSLTPNDPRAEAQLILQAMGRLGCTHVVHDYGGAGSLREQFLVDAGLPLDRIVPISLLRVVSGPLMEFQPPTSWRPRGYFQLDKARSLSLTCNQIRAGQLRFFRYDHRSSDDRGLLHDFLALVEDIVDSRRGSNIHTIISAARQSDDFAQAVNLGCCALWHMARRWPNVAAVTNMTLDPMVQEAIHPNRARPATDGY